MSESIKVSEPMSGQRRTLGTILVFPIIVIVLLGGRIVAFLVAHGIPIGVDVAIYFIVVLLSVSVQFLVLFAGRNKKVVTSLLDVNVHQDSNLIRMMYVFAGYAMSRMRGIKRILLCQEGIVIIFQEGRSALFPWKKYCSFNADPDTCHIQLNAITGSIPLYLPDNYDEAARIISEHIPKGN